MEDDVGACNTGLCLGLGIGGYVPKKKKQIRESNNQVPFELYPDGETMDRHEDLGLFRIKRMDHDTSTNCRKKLRLTKDQSALLEESFKLHATLNPAQKQSLAEQLKLRPRQVEVWFQNRRARTKLKKTEIDCEFLRKCCENLRDENRRLKKELQELRPQKIGTSPMFIQLSKTAAATTTTTCSSCQKPFKANDANNNDNKNNNNKKNKLERDCC
ncbi:homeobox-leucine zipper protein HAT22-like [Prosopis cineraria]|uniref:homeobox-leucine zipper protein HAT22-like n=1 Tax=Prosopis cineraria TaxID=364024 RepID=UPI00240FD7DA|nr:homeobox-leucine zipper protein HAT22-like [Prosopis cineraria]